MADYFLSPGLDAFIFSPMGIAVILGIGLFLGWQFLGKNRKTETFKGTPLPDMVMSESKAILKTFGMRSGKKLFRGLYYIGDIQRFADQKINIKSEKAEIQGIMKTVYLFSVIQPGMMAKIMSWLGYGIEIYAIDKAFCTIDVESGNYFLSENTLFSRLGGIWIMSNDGAEMVTGFAWKHGYEATLEDIVNYSKKVTYLDSTQPKKIEVIEKEADLESKKWNSFLKQKLGD
jgi:hypothetical protein